MGELSGLTWSVVLAFVNLILSSAIVVTAFSLLGYVLTHNLRSSVAQAFSVLLACVLLVYACDIIIPRVESGQAVEAWLRVQWIGIAIVPAAYFHLSDALLRSTRHFSRRRRMAVIASYLVSAALVFLALFTNVVVTDGDVTPPISHLEAGPLFPLFVAYFATIATYGAYNVVRARRRCLTPASRRRMTYLAVSFAAPGLGVFPYVIISSGLVTQLSPSVVLFLAVIANILVGAMLVVMAYSVAYYGVLTPDRVIRHDLLHYLLRGPVLGTMVIVVMLVIPRVELILGLPRDTALIFVVVGMIVLGQLILGAAKPYLDRLIFRQDREEIAWIQTLDRRLLTSSDLHQFLNNVLIGLCELLRVDTGFVLVQTAEGLRVEVAVGDLESARRFASQPEGRTTWQALAQEPKGGDGEPYFRPDGDFWFCPLRSEDDIQMLGLLAVRARSSIVEMEPSEAEEVDRLLAQAASAIADRYVQEGVFTTLQRILPDLERIQEWRSELRYAPPLPPEAEAQPIEADVPPPESGLQPQASLLYTWVKDALSHYWGGSKLTENPLVHLETVQRSLAMHDNNLPRAVRAVLQEAIDRQRPAGERKLTAPEWLFYNILDMRFVQGQRVRDIAVRLSMSESDLYRKQRAAVAEVTRTLTEMEA
ncbi:MAG: hypothetical protein H6Q86_4586, partial [candidate division NC10 bacterium]|nr:hypothetical protein [candidate division NC10 bacterium]